ncbi:glycosyl hydrolase [Kiritimatiella glycovorans]|uniref:Glycoside hydrolase family 2 sugar binding n=1 Tax=Kiritimatiella glycovorans TaxID=1307763 RepID=A0A0G3ELH1_9BACT|nr:glycosyl hydrolase [Kiritimatiella glycovorans]AKJ65630.1 Glycoside hydrolase family 2 sugar binding [Kiritimatiella glycovorans]
MKANKAVVLFAATVAFAGGACADVVVASADAMIDGGGPDTNFGSDDQLYLRGGGGVSTEKLYYQFDVEGILGSGEVFDGVEFSITTHPTQPANTTGFNWTLHGITDNNDSWTENGITWANAPKNDTSGTGVDSTGTTTLANFTFDPVPAGTDTYTISGAGLDEYLNWKAGAIADPYGNGAADNTVATIIVTANNGFLGRILSLEGTGLQTRKPQLSFDVVPYVVPELAISFRNPPREASAATWWHWMNGSVTEEGITKDLEAFARVGVETVMLFSVNHYVAGPVRFGTDEWFEMIEHFLREAARLDLEVGFHNCDGFNEAGGPWVPVEESMKRLSWTETAVEAGTSNPIRLPLPDVRDGFYCDIAVLAFPEEARARNLLTARAVDLGGHLEALTDSSWLTGPELQKGEDGLDYQFTFRFCEPASPASFLAVLDTAARRGNVRLEVKRDEAWRVVGRCEFVGRHDASYRLVSGKIDDLSPAREFRLSVSAGSPVRLAELVLSEAPRVPAFGQLAGHQKYGRHFDEAIPLREWGASDAGIDPAEIIDLSGCMGPDGSLDWHPDSGDWTVIRMGFTTTGAKNHPATREGTGYEVDKFDPRAVERHFDAYLGKIAELAAELPENPLRYTEVDSWEAGPQNWSAVLPDFFAGRNGYSLDPWMVALTGRIVESPLATKQFLYDFRESIAEAVAVNFIGEMRRQSEERGLTFLCEAYGSGIFSHIRSGYQAGMPMDEFWGRYGVENPDAVPKTNPEAKLEISELGMGREMTYRAPSAAHTAPSAPWRSPRVSAEAFTSQPVTSSWQNHPRALKRLGDAAFATGINWFVFHTSTHQPYEGFAPGMTFSRWGIHFERANTWFDLSAPWLDYLGRAQAVLQHGRSVREVCLLTTRAIDTFGRPFDLTLGNYFFDWAAPEALVGAGVEDGRLLLANGQEYDLLMLDSREGIPLEVLRKLSALLEAGLTVIAQKPSHPISRRHLPEAAAEVDSLSDALWGPGEPAPRGERSIGNGRLLWGWTPVEALEHLGIPNDFTIPGQENDPDIPVNFCHRRLPEREVYFLANRSKQKIAFTGLFRSGAETASLWFPDSGRIERLEVMQRDDGRWSAELELDTYESAFVVFGPVPRVAEPPPTATRTLASIPGPWTLRFQPGRGAPEQVTLQSLQDLAEHDLPGVRDFSGVIDYETTFSFDGDPSAPGLALDFDRVEVIAEVFLNGSQIGATWTFPHRIPVGEAMLRGENLLRVRVATTWVNRLIADSRLPIDANWLPDTGLGLGQGAFLREWPEWFQDPDLPRPTERIGFATYKWWTPEDASMPSGLLGQVRLVAAITDSEVSR